MSSANKTWKVCYHFENLLIIAIKLMYLDDTKPRVNNCFNDILFDLFLDCKTAFAFD